MRKVVLITGSAGLVGGAATRRFHSLGYEVAGVDNNMREYFFGPQANTSLAAKSLSGDLKHYSHIDIDIRDYAGLEQLYQSIAPRLAAVVHCAAQPSHDWAAREPLTDFSVNAVATLNLLELTRKYSPDAAFIFMSTNKVYGDGPNGIPLIEAPSRWTPRDAEWIRGISEGMSIDGCTHSIFGVSKASADLMVQEYGRYFDMNTVCFRGGCLTGPSHAGAELHGFLSYLVKCVVHERPYTVFGHKGKQVRDNIHSDDLAEAFVHYLAKPTPGAVYNIGGGIYANISMLEAIEQIEYLSGKRLEWDLSDEPRVGDHIWYVSDLSKFQAAYPSWSITKNIDAILHEMVAAEFDKGAGR